MEKRYRNKIILIIIIIKEGIEKRRLELYSQDFKARGEPISVDPGPPRAVDK